MPVIEPIGRRQCIPILYTRGTHYEVGFDVGRNFASIIQNLVNSISSLNEDFLPAYETPEGRKAYEDTLASVRKHFPQYVRELEGTADGAKVPFHKLFLLHMDRIILAPMEKEYPSQPVGCTAICVNQRSGEIHGHTEDALSETLNHFYFVSAHIISEKPQGRWGVTEEKFTSLCYAGHLPGYTMNYNHHGLVFSINTLSAKKVLPGKIPRHFLTRALLSAENYSQAENILRDPGCGAGDGCSVNMLFLNQEGERIFYNIEMAPALEEKMSRLNIQKFPRGENSMHCNKYLRLQIVEEQGTLVESSEARMCTLKSYPKPMTKNDVITMLGDQSGDKYHVFQESGPEDFVKTIAVGIFDLKERTWSIYADNPRYNEPIVVLPLVVKDKSKEY